MSIFEKILAPLLEPAHGLQCAVVADSDGEMVARLGHYEGIGDETSAAEATALFGAHQGIILIQLLFSGPQEHSGMLREISVRCEGEDWFVFPLATEYYLAVAGPHGVRIGRIRAAIQKCVSRLSAEITK